MSNEKLEEEYEKVFNACEIRASSGRQRHLKMSISHINEAFNEEVQVDFIVV